MRFAGAAVVIRSQVRLTGPAVRDASIGMSYEPATDLSLTGGCVLNALSLLPLTHLTPALLESANTVSLPTSSKSTPTSTTPAQDAHKVQPKSVTINDNEEVLVSGNAQENFFTEEPEPVNDSVFKCPGCTLLTIHQGFEFQALHVDGGITHIRRLYMCTNCGKFATK